MVEMSRHEKRFRSANRVLFVLIGLWIPSIVDIGFPTPGIRDSDWRFLAWATLVSLLLVSMFTLSIVSIVAYMRWTGKYPYYFLSPSSRERVRKLREERVDADHKRNKRDH